MKKKIYGYIRVSTIAQHDDRQRLAMEEFGIEEQFLFADKQSGKDFDRPAYQALLGKIGAGDTLVVNIKTRYLIQSYRHGTLGRRLWHQRYLYLPCLRRSLKNGETPSADFHSTHCHEYPAAHHKKRNFRLSWRIIV